MAPLDQTSQIWGPKLKVWLHKHRKTTVDRIWIPRYSCSGPMYPLLKACNFVPPELVLMFVQYPALRFSSKVPLRPVAKPKCIIPDGYLEPFSTCAALSRRRSVFGVRRHAPGKAFLTIPPAPLLFLRRRFPFVIMMFNLPLPGGNHRPRVGIAGSRPLILGPWASLILGDIDCPCSFRRCFLVI